MIAFIDEHRGVYGVEPICTPLPIAPSIYHRHAARRADPGRLAARARRDAVRGRKLRTTILDPAAAWPWDRVNRQLEAPCPNALEVGDLTYVASWSGFVYAAFMIDAYTRRIVGWRVSRTAHAGFVLEALEQALHERRPVQGEGLVHHADCGIQGGCRRSSQHGRCELIAGSGPAPRPGFSNRGSCEARR